MSATHIRRRLGCPVGAALALVALALSLAAAQQAGPSAAPTKTNSSPAAAANASSPPAGAAAPRSLLPLTPAQVLTHVTRSVAWYHDLSTAEQIDIPGMGAGPRSQLQQQALATVQLGFQFGKAAEDIIGREQQAQTASHAGHNGAAPAQAGPPTRTAQLERAAADMSEREVELKTQMAAIDVQLRRVRTARARARLQAQRGGISAALQLVEEIKSNVDQLRRFQESAIAGQGKPPKGLRAQLAYLQKSIPELSTSATPTAATAAAAHGASTSSAAAKTGGAGAAKSSGNFQPQSAGILALIGQWFSLHSYRGQLELASRDTTGLAGELTATRSQVLDTVRQLAGNGLTSIAAGSAAQLADQRGPIETATGQLRELSGVLIPLDEQAMALTGAQNTLDDWSQTLGAQQSAVEKYLGLRIGILLAWVAAVLVISEIWRRATFRYLADSRRRRPFLMLRRVVVGAALILVVIFSLVSQFGSIATYAGFVTAGLAVALQNVILSVVAYFFLIGKYGVKVGDRVTISGVTGRVVDISLLRIYLMELSGSDLHSSGRMVVLSNSVFFQPTALFKQIPGAEYLWHSVTLTIVATADVEKAYSRLQSAANRVYETYRAAIERQHDIAQRFIEFETAAPAPEVRVRLTDTGLECSVRYPVVPEKSARIDQQMLEALRRAVESDEQLKLVASGGMVLKSSEG